MGEKEFRWRVVKLSDPHYDCIVLDIPENIDKVKSWLKKLNTKLLSEIQFLKSAIEAGKPPSDKDPELFTKLWPGVPELDPTYAGTPVALVGYHTTQIDGIPDYPVLLLQLKQQRLNMLQVLQKAQWRFDALYEDMMVGGGGAGRQVLFVWESMWYVFGYEYLFDKYEFLKDPFFSQNQYPFSVVNDYYFPSFSFFFL